MAEQDAYEYVTVNVGINATESQDAYEYVTVNVIIADTTYKRGYGISRYL